MFAEKSAPENIGNRQKDWAKTVYQMFFGGGREIIKWEGNLFQQLLSIFEENGHLHIQNKTQGS